MNYFTNLTKLITALIIDLNCKSIPFMFFMSHILFLSYLKKLTYAYMGLGMTCGIKRTFTGYVRSKRI